ncbi:hypothetical protein FIBSPDRAFT_866718, partial [Athelia psychrophila]
MHEGRVDALKGLLFPPPYPHAHEGKWEGCSAEDRVGVSRAWSLAAISLAADADDHVDVQEQLCAAFHHVVDPSHPKQGFSTQCARLISARTGIPNSNPRAGKKDEDEDDTPEDAARYDAMGLCLCDGYGLSSVSQDSGLRTRSASRLGERARPACADAYYGGDIKIVTLAIFASDAPRSMLDALLPLRLIHTFFPFYFYPSAHNTNTNTRTPGRRAHTPTGYRPRG